MARAGLSPSRSATLFGGLGELPSLVAKRCEVSANSRSIATVSIASAIPLPPASASASLPACAIRSNGERPRAAGVDRSVTSPQPTRIGVESSGISRSWSGTRAPVNAGALPRRTNRVQMPAKPARKAGAREEIMNRLGAIAAGSALALAGAFAVQAQEKISDGVVKIGLIEDMSSLYADI